MQAAFTYWLKTYQKDSFNNSSSFGNALFSANSVALLRYTASGPLAMQRGLSFRFSDAFAGSPDGVQCGSVGH
jgi:hypothetical protein